MRFYNTSGKIISEGISTRNAEAYGWDLGHQRVPFWRKTINFFTQPFLVKLTNILK